MCQETYVRNLIVDLIVQKLLCVLSILCILNTNLVVARKTAHMGGLVGLDFSPISFGIGKYRILSCELF